MSQAKNERRRRPPTSRIRCTRGNFLHAAVSVPNRVGGARADDTAIAQAAAELAAFIELQAEQTALAVGFGFELEANAPSTYPDL